MTTLCSHKSQVKICRQITRSDEPQHLSLSVSQCVAYRGARARVVADNGAEDRDLLRGEHTAHDAPAELALPRLFGLAEGRHQTEHTGCAAPQAACASAATPACTGVNGGLSRDPKRATGEASMPACMGDSPSGE